MEDGLIRSTTIYISSRAHLNLTFNLCQCGVTELLRGGSIVPEAADTFTLYYVNRGSLLLQCGPLSFKMNAKQGLFVFPDMRIELHNLGEEDVEMVWVTFTGYQVESYLNRANIFRSKPVFEDPDDGLGACINKIYHESQKFPNRYCKMMSAMYELFARMLDANPTRQSSNYVDNSNYFAARALDFVNHNYAANITVDEIAEALGITRKYLYAVFNYVFGISPKQYLIYYRIEKACKRLKSTDQPVREIAETVGYSNQFYFAREFKRLTGMTPTDYRKSPENTEIFSYRAFASTLTDKMQSIALPFNEYLSDSTYEPLNKEDD